MQTDDVCLFLVALSGLCHVFSQEVQPPNPTLVEFRNELLDDGGYSFRYVLSDDTERDEFASPEPNGTFFVSGHYTYIDPNGVEQYVEYYADKTGYHPKLGEREKIKVPMLPAVAVSPGLVGSLLGR